MIVSANSLTRDNVAKLVKEGELLINCGWGRKLEYLGRGYLENNLT